MFRHRFASLKCDWWNAYKRTQDESHKLHLTRFPFLHYFPSKSPQNLSSRSPANGAAQVNGDAVAQPVLGVGHQYPSLLPAVPPLPLPPPVVDTNLLIRGMKLCSENFNNNYRDFNTLTLRLLQCPRVVLMGRSDVRFIVQMRQRHPDWQVLSLIDGHGLRQYAELRGVPIDYAYANQNQADNGDGEDQADDGDGEDQADDGDGEDQADDGDNEQEMVE